MHTPWYGGVVNASSCLDPLGVNSTSYVLQDTNPVLTPQTRHNNQAHPLIAETEQTEQAARNAYQTVGACTVTFTTEQVK